MFLNSDSNVILFCVILDIWSYNWVQTVLTLLHKGHFPDLSTSLHKPYIKIEHAGLAESITCWILEYSTDLSVKRRSSPNDPNAHPCLGRGAAAVSTCAVMAAPVIWRHNQPCSSTAEHRMEFGNSYKSPTGTLVSTLTSSAQRISRQPFRFTHMLVHISD